MSNSSSDDIFLSTEEGYQSIRESDINQPITEQNIVTDTETKVDNILNKLNYNSLQDVQDMLYLSLKRLDDKENELLLYQKKCKAYEKVIALLKKEIKVLKNNRK